MRIEQYFDLVRVFDAPLANGQAMAIHCSLLDLKWGKSAPFVVVNKDVATSNVEGLPAPTGEADASIIPKMVMMLETLARIYDGQVVG